VKWDLKTQERWKGVSGPLKGEMGFKYPKKMEGGFRTPKR